MGTPLAPVPPVHTMSHERTIENLRQLEQRITEAEPTAGWELELLFHKCDGDECNQGPPPHAVVARPGCHRNAPSIAVYYDGRLLLACWKCGKHMAVLEIA